MLGTLLRKDLGAGYGRAQTDKERTPTSHEYETCLRHGWGTRLCIIVRVRVLSCGSSAGTHHEVGRQTQQALHTMAEMGTPAGRAAYTSKSCLRVQKVERCTRRHKSGQKQEGLSGALRKKAEAASVGRACALQARADG